KEIGESFLKAGKAEDAEFFFRESLKQVGENMSEQEKEGAVHTYNRLGIALRRQGKWAEAVKEYEQAVKIGPNNEVLYYNLGKAHLEGGQRPEARKCFQKALLIDPEFQEAKEEFDAIS
ncbi:MAG: tetratricopeptide repeat protein, partial [Nitrospinota bacterium]